jgi:hypothetical protein
MTSLHSVAPGLASGASGLASGAPGFASGEAVEAPSCAVAAPASPPSGTTTTSVVLPQPVTNATTHVVSGTNKPASDGLPVFMPSTWRGAPDLVGFFRGSSVFLRSSGKSDLHAP